MVSRVAMPLFRQAQLGEADAQLALGKIYLDGGHGMKRDTGTAFYWLNKAASNGSMEARRLIGRSHAPNALPEKGHENEMGQTSETTSANADVALAEWLLTGRVAANDDVNAADVLRRAAAKGERIAQLRLAMLLLATGNDPEEVDEAVIWLKRAAESGSRAAAVRLADRYWENCDPAAGVWLEQLAESAEPDILYRLGITLLARGKTLEGSSMLARAAQQEHTPAQLCYGLLHACSHGRRETGVPHSLKKAAFWLEKASERGCGQASFELYRLYRLRQFSLKNSALAERYLETAAAQGHVDAQFQCGVARLRGAVARDRDVEAAKWLMQAAKRGHRNARCLYRLLYGKSLATPIPFADDPSRLVRLLARTRIALATRVEIGHVMRLDLPELLLFDPESADHGDFIVLDVRAHTRRANRRIVAVETAAERTLLDRARRLLNLRNPHPTDVRGSLCDRRLDMSQTLRLLGSETGQQAQAGSVQGA